MPSFLQSLVSPRPGAAAASPSGPDTPLVRLKGVEKSFPAGAGRVYVLRNVDLEIRRGEFVSVMGPSGAGKSTLLAILGMFDADWTGEYHFAGEAVHTLSPKARMAINRREMGFVFQQYHLLDDLTVRENLEVPLSYRDVPRKEREARVADVLDRFRIVGKKDLFPSQLSGGQQQLVGIARAVVAGPAVILADEPTGNLHSAQGREIMELFRQLNQEGTTIIQVTHSEANAAYGNRVVELADGWVVKS
jgi:ABC-type lipoprotein export system ATPase subunit